MDIVGWLSPSPMEVTVSGTATVVENGLTLYTAMKEGTGAIRVFLQPDTVTPADPKWRRVGTTSWMNAGTAENHVPAGWYDVEFAPIQGWKTPEPRTVRVTEGQTTYLHLHYEPGSDVIEGEGETLEGELPEGEIVEPKEGEVTEGEIVEPKEGELQEGETVEPKEGEVTEGEIVEPQEGEVQEGEPIEPQEGELPEGEIVVPQEGEVQEGEPVEPQEGELPEGEIVVPQEGELPEGEIVVPQEGELQEGEPVEGEVQEGELNEGETEEGEMGEGEPPVEGEGEPPVELVTVPDIIGKSRDEAVTLLEALGLQVVVQEENSKAPKDEVIVQYPASGAEATPGDTITLTVSTGNSGSLCGCGPREKSGGDYKGDFVLLLLLSFVLIVSNVAQRKTNTAVARKA
ncbi:MAG: PASTA domain protein [Candidatus Hydrogenedentes bacterium ADurb.Bin101]|nr:MAG: PASTA domain protein [Candidatus Hydrogenedentes bacterium ADurb.Bin101]